MGLGLTRGQIITEGLSQAGRPDLTSNARLWLNTYLEATYYNQDFEWLVKTLDNQTVVQGGTLPLDYRAMKSAMVTSNGAKIPLEEVGADKYDDLRRQNAGTAGVPQYVFPDLDTRTVYFLPVPITGLTWDQKYYYMPDIPDHTLSVNDLEVPKWELPVDILIRHIYQKALQYNDDTRADKAEEGLKMSLMEAKMNNQDRRAGIHRLKFGKSFKRRF